MRVANGKRVRVWANDHPSKKNKREQKVEYKKKKEKKKITNQIQQRHKNQN